MITRKEVFKIGQFNRPHGIHGELSFTFTNDSFDQAESDYLICLLDGIFVPFFIEEYRFRSDTTALVKLEDIDSAEKARMFTNVEVYFPVKYMNEANDENGFGWDFFEGFTIYDRITGHVGEIVDVDQSTINVLFVVERDGKQLLLPAQDDLIVEMDTENRTLLMDLPEGLIEF